MTQDVLKQLGLTGHPFGAPFRQPLRPRQDSDLEAYVRVEGFGKQVSEIDTWFATPGNQIENETTTILVYGPKRTGRSSVANYIYRRYCGLALDSRLTPIPISAILDHSDPLLPVQALMADIYTQLLSVRPNLSTSDPDLHASFDKYGFSDTPAPRLRYAQMFKSAAEFLEIRSLIIMVDNLDTYEQVSNILSVFQQVPIVIFTTSKESVLRNFLSEQLHGFCIKLSELTLEDIVGFVQQRWQSCSGTLPPPFPSDVLEFSFGPSRKWAFKGVVGVISEVYMNYIDAVQRGTFNDQSGAPQIPTRVMEAWFRDAMERLGLITYNSDGT